MPRILTALTLWLALTAGALGQTVPLEISGDTVVVVKSLPFKITAAPGADVYIWNHPSTVKSVEDENVLTITEAPAGQLTVKIQTITIDYANKKTVKARGQVTFVVGEVPPPVPPIPPVPPTPPKPPEPPAPIPVAGVRVLIVYETSQMSKMPQAQQSILFSATFRKYLDGVCADDPQTGTKKAWWMLDKDSDTSTLAKHWQDAMKRERKSLPWVIISNGTTGYEGPLPANIDETTALIKKYVPAARKGR